MGSMVIGLVSDSMEKLIVTSVVTGGAVALDMEVDIYLLLGGAYAFLKDVVEQKVHKYDRPELKEQMLAGMEANKVPLPLENLRNLKKDGNVRIHVCATAGKIWGATRRDDFVDLVDDIVGLAEYLTKVEEAEVVQVL
jgi:peroxiredoxin family protein